MNATTFLKKASWLTMAISAGIVIFFLGSTRRPSAVRAQVEDEAATTSCTEATLKGNYGVLASGAFVGGKTYSNVGILLFDGKGNVTETSWGYQGAKDSATDPYEETLVGTYTLPKNPILGSTCLIKMTQHETQPTLSNEEFSYEIVVVNGGAEIDMMSTSNGLIQTQIAKRM